jgi:hypothetical protein
VHDHGRGERPEDLVVAEGSRRLHERARRGVARQLRDGEHGRERLDAQSHLLLPLGARLKRDETCPISTEGWTGRVHFCTGGGGGAPRARRLAGSRVAPRCRACRAPRSTSRPRSAPRPARRPAPAPATTQRAPPASARRTAAAGAGCRVAGGGSAGTHLWVAVPEALPALVRARVVRRPRLGLAELLAKILDEGRGVHPPRSEYEHLGREAVARVVSGEDRGEVRGLEAQVLVHPLPARRDDERRHVPELHRDALLQRRRALGLAPPALLRRRAPHDLLRRSETAGDVHVLDERVRGEERAGPAVARRARKEAVAPERREDGGDGRGVREAQFVVLGDHDVAVDEEPVEDVDELEERLRAPAGRAR